MGFILFTKNVPPQLAQRAVGEAPLQALSNMYFTTGTVHKDRGHQKAAAPTAQDSASSFTSKPMQCMSSKKQADVRCRCGRKGNACTRQSEKPLH